jgi:hypothetical protein
MSTLKEIVKYNYIIGCDYIIIVTNPNSLKKNLPMCNNSVLHPQPNFQLQQVQDSKNKP